MLCFFNTFVTPIKYVHVHVNVIQICSLTGVADWKQPELQRGTEVHG